MKQFIAHSVFRQKSDLFLYLEKQLKKKKPKLAWVVLKHVCLELS